MESMVDDVEAAKRLDSQALAVKVQFEQPAATVAAVGAPSALSPRPVAAPFRRAAEELKGEGIAAGGGVKSPGQPAMKEGGASGAAVKRPAPAEGQMPGGGDAVKKAKHGGKEQDLESLLTELDGA